MYRQKIVSHLLLTGRQLFLFASTKTSEEKTKTLFWKSESSVKELSAQISKTNLKKRTL